MSAALDEPRADAWSAFLAASRKLHLLVGAVVGAAGLQVVWLLHRRLYDLLSPQTSIDPNAFHHWLMFLSLAAAVFVLTLNPRQRPRIFAAFVVGSLAGALGQAATGDSFFAHALSGAICWGAIAIILGSQNASGIYAILGAGLSVLTLGLARAAHQLVGELGTYAMYGAGMGALASLLLWELQKREISLIRSASTHSLTPIS